MLSVIWQPFCPRGDELTHWGRDNGLSPGWCQAIIWTNAAILLIGPLGKNFNEIHSKIHTFSFKKINLKCLLENGGHFVSASQNPTCISPALTTELNGVICEHFRGNWSCYNHILFRFQLFSFQTTLFHTMHIVMPDSIDVVLAVFNSLVPGKFEWNFIYIIFKQILVIDCWGIFCEIALI